jgi:NAD-dependent DNA ligase
MEELVIQNGGTVGAVTKNLSYLVQADPSSQSTKTQKAVKLGVVILSEKKFFEMLK